MWLAPYVNIKENKFNTIYILFEGQVIVSAINIWNYTKTPNRGVREVEISLDDKIIYKVKYEHKIN